MTSKKEKQEIKKDSYKDLKNIKEKFIGKQAKPFKESEKQIKKRQAKDAQKARKIAKTGGSKFAGDFETDAGQNKGNKKKNKDEQEQKKGNFRKYEQTDKSYKGKRNTMGAKFAGFRGEKSLKKLKGK